MKVWLYYRLSRDEDDELNSLTNQRKIIYEYLDLLATRRAYISSFFSRPNMYALISKSPSESIC